MWLCAFNCDTFHVESYFAPCSYVFSVLFSIVVCSVGEEGVDLYTSRAFVCLTCMRCFLSFSFPLGVGGWLQIVTAALPGL